jgi:D-serine deaminase-like pyridoxal phosphate-dependent protein
MPILDQLDTPCIVVDMEKTERNIRRMAEAAKAANVRLRPHAKTHKLPLLANKQIEAGAVGVTAAKVSEAEALADGGVPDIFIAYPLIDQSKIERAIRLSERIRLIVGVDSLEGAQRLSAEALRLGHTLEVRLEVDTGLRRTGIPFDQAVRLARDIAQLEGLNLSGIYTFRGALLDGSPTMDTQTAGLQEGRMMVRLAEEIRGEGIPIRDVSAGSTPTGVYAAQVEGVTEIRPGTYIYQDRMTAKFGVCSLDDCAAYVLCTVVSRPAEGYAVIDGGSKTFATDVQPMVAPLYLQGFGHILEAPDALLERMSEEHGMLRLEAHHTLKPGDKIRIIPNHICSTINLHNEIYLVYGNRVEAARVDARGTLQ